MPQREVIKLALDEIIAEVGVALRDAHLDFPVLCCNSRIGTVISNDRHFARPDRYAMAPSNRHRLSHHWATTR